MGVWIKPLKFGKGVKPIRNVSRCCLALVLVRLLGYCRGTSGDVCDWLRLATPTHFSTIRFCSAMGGIAFPNHMRYIIAPSPCVRGAGWFHTKKEKSISFDFSFCSRDFYPSPNLSPTGGEALKARFIFFSGCMKPPCSPSYSLNFSMKFNIFRQFCQYIVPILYLLN